MAKKLLVTAIVLFALFCNAPLSFATSGACSYHGGVDCKVIDALYGNAICTDGWVSSVAYKDTNECNQTATPTFCIPPVPGFCTTQNNYGRMASEGYQNGAYYSPAWSQQLAACQSAINQYQAQQISYQSCLKNAPPLVKPTPIISPPPSQESKNSDTSSYVNSVMQNWCAANYASSSVWDPVSRGCSCKDGYKYDFGSTSCQKIVTCNDGYANINNKCVSPDQRCASTFGIGSIADKGAKEVDGALPCTCLEGYQWAKDKTNGCIKIVIPAAKPKPVNNTQVNSNKVAPAIPPTDSSVSAKNSAVVSTKADQWVIKVQVASTSSAAAPIQPVAAPKKVGFWQSIWVFFFGK